MRRLEEKRERREDGSDRSRVKGKEQDKKEDKKIEKERLMFCIFCGSLENVSGNAEYKVDVIVSPHCPLY